MSKALFHKAPNQTQAKQSVTAMKIFEQRTYINYESVVYAHAQAWVEGAFWYQQAEMKH